jgi:hypothetical protein
MNVIVLTINVILDDPCDRAVCGHSLARIAVSNPAGRMSVSCECCVLSGRGLCVGLITCREESYRLWCF